MYELMPPQIRLLYYSVPQVLCNVDELFEYEELSAAPDPGWPDCFNSGVFVFTPSLNTHTQILEHAAQHGSFDGESLRYI